MDIIIAGGGKVGLTLARQLVAEGHNLTLIDRDSHILETAVEQYDAIAVLGNCASKEVLLRAGVAGADLLIAATNADEVNLLCCMTGNGLNKNLHTIARIRNPEYADQVMTMRDVFPLSMTVNPERQAAVVISLYGGSRGVPQIITKLSRGENSSIGDSMALGSMICPKELCCNQIVRNNGRPMDEKVLSNTNAYLAAYVIIVILSFLLISRDGFSTGTNLSAVLACFNNIGPGLEAVGTTCNFGAYSVFSKMILIVDMLAGRLEIFPMLILLSRSTWSPHRQK